MKKILIIDDSTTNIVLLEAILEGEECEIYTATNVDEAFYIIKKSIPDLILLDLVMPKIDGFEFLEKIKSDEKTKKILVLVVSALVNDESIKKCMSMGALDFIKKPIDIQELKNKVIEILDNEVYS